MKFKSANSNEVGIQFKVWCPTFNRITHRLFLLGSLPELGAWNIDEALEAYSTIDLHIWQVEAAIPPMSRFEWVWLKTSVDRSTTEWERPVKRNMDVNCFSGTLHTIWGDSQEVFLQSATCAEITTFMKVEEGYTMVLTGSTVTTGLWDINGAIAAHEFPKHSGYWKAQVTFDALTHLDFRWAVVKVKDRSQVRVKEKLAHSLYGRRAWMRAVAPWMMPIVVVVDTPALCDFSDNMLGRSDVIVNERKKRLEEIKKWQTESSKPFVSSRPSSIISSVSKPPETEKAATKSSSLTPSTFSTPPYPSTTRKSSIQRSGNLDEHTKHKHGGSSRTERLTKQLNKNFKESTSVLKGVGSAKAPTDLFNAGPHTFVPVISEGESKAFGDFSALNRPVDIITGAVVNEKAHTARQRKGSSNRKLNTSQQKASYQEDTFQSTICNRSERKSRKDEIKLEASSRKNSEERTQDYPIKPFEDFIQRLIQENNLKSVDQKSKEICPEVESSLKDVQSDTGFTEISSTISNPITDPLKSETAAVKTDVRNCVTPTLTSTPNIDPVLGSDVDEGYSESEMPLTIPKIARMDFGMQNYWEIHQSGLEPSWLSETRDGLFSSDIAQGNFQSEDLTVWAENGEHLEWMASKVDMENEYCTSELGLGFEIPPDHPFIGNVVFMSGGKQKAMADSSLPCSLINLESVDTAGFTLPEGNVCSNNDTPTPDDAEQSEISPKDELLQIEGAGLATQLRQGRSSDEDGDLNERRQIARSLEFQWGASSGGGTQPKEDMVTPIELITDEPIELRDLSLPHSCSMNGDGEFNSDTYQKYKVTEYSCSEFSNAVGSMTKVVDRRARAREIEKEWGEKQRSRSLTRLTRGSDVKTSASLACGDITKFKKSSTSKKRLL